MGRSAKTLRDLLTTLEERGLVMPGVVDRARKQSAAARSERTEAWYAKTLTGCGAWVAMGFLLGFLTAMEILRSGANLIPGGFMILMGLGMFQARNEALPEQAGLASSLAGQFLIYETIWTNTRGGFFPMMVAVILLSGVLYSLVTSSTHRFLTVLMGWSALLLTVGHHDAFGNLHFLILGLGLLTGFLHLSPMVGPFWRDLGRASALCLTITLGLAVWALNHLPIPWLASLELGAMGCGLAWLTWVRSGRFGTWTLGITVGTCLLFGFLSSPGVNGALLLIGLGYSVRERYLQDLGMALLPVFLTAYYYSLVLTLWQKSLILTGSGAILLALYGLLRQTAAEGDQA